MKAHWSLDWSITHLNHGSFGATLLQAQHLAHALRQELEADPLGFILTRYEPLLQDSRQRLADAFGASPQGLVFVHNATAGVHAALGSVNLEPGDQLICTNHSYGACALAMRHVAARAGAQVVRVDLPLLGLRDPAQLIEPILDACTPKTRLVMLDHISSATGIIHPIEQLIPELHARGAQVLIDGAHAPGMVPLNLEALGADYYTGNGHKWVCAPRGAAFLYVAPQHRARVNPPVRSHGAALAPEAPGRLHAEFDWIGTMDLTPWLCFGPTLEMMQALVPGGWSELRARNAALLRQGRRLLCERLQIEAPCPESMLGSMASLPLWDDPEPAPTSALRMSAQQRWLMEQARIQVWMGHWPAHPKRLLRVSAHLYNELEDYARLADALLELRGP